ncbi:hypothetical protein [Streptosporangium carneum]|uniref:Uncharacterized protein n=1 Tax=Streptosporangium carneum TaxID=47481 RepID=A0A9W6MBE2_9ACTN|nr:hypothetical protein [Streptosporangium carneum]GLK07588.1 hypothetical protein GCM10017600_09930 [Streptosporangium carneum]
MGEFDLDPRVEGAAGFGWEAHFRSAAPDGMRMADDSDGCVYACDPTWHTCSYTCYACGNTHTCGATGRPCIC